MMQGMIFSWLIGRHAIFGPHSKHTVFFWTSFAKNNMNTDNTVCFVLGLFYCMHLLLSSDTPLKDLKALCLEALPLCTATQRPGTPQRAMQVLCLAWLHLERTKLFGKQHRHIFEMSNSCIWTACLLYYALWGWRSQGLDRFKMNQWHLLLSPDRLSNMHLSSEMFKMSTWLYFQRYAHWMWHSTLKALKNHWCAAT